MNAHKLEAVLICETWLQPGQRDPKIPGFTLHRTDRRDGEVGGPTIYVRNEIKHSASYVPDFRQLQATAVTVETAKGLLRLTAPQIDDISGLTSQLATSTPNTRNGTADKAIRTLRRLQTLLQSSADVDFISTGKPTFYDRSGPYSSRDVLDIALVKNLRHVIDVTVVDELHSDHLSVIMCIGNESNEPTPHVYYVFFSQ